MGAKNIFLTRQRHCKNCGKRFRSDRRATCSDECHIELVKAFAAKQDQSRQKQIATSSATSAALDSATVSAIPKTIYEALSRYGHDEDFEPRIDCDAVSKEFYGTIHGPGSEEKIEVLRRRVELGLPLWHEDDARVCSRVSNTGPSVIAKFGNIRTTKMSQSRWKKIGE